MNQFVDLSGTERIYLVEAIDRLHQENSAILQNLQRDQTGSGYSLEDVFSLMAKERNLYEALRAKLTR